ncbi:hypothetical protein BKA70DRAFT_1336986 [Coprinopsis sp. MPI-PUGE-AT-0042]|nr:hypothetical protein BKA70DRAFT_1336986 [Coprinopsis sp. MPI-PUGE-AT-0042]
MAPMTRRCPLAALLLCCCSYECAGAKRTSTALSLTLLLPAPWLEPEALLGHDSRSRGVGGQWKRGTRLMASWINEVVSD